MLTKIEFFEVYRVLWVLEFVDTDLEDHHLQIKYFTSIKAASKSLVGPTRCRGWSASADTFQNCAAWAPRFLSRAGPCGSPQHLPLPFSWVKRGPWFFVYQGEIKLFLVCCSFVQNLFLFYSGESVLLVGFFQDCFLDFV